MAEIFSLIPPPTDETQIQQSVVKLLEETLAFAKEGKINGLVMIVSRSDGNWYPAYAETGEFSLYIGRLEILKQVWIRNSLDENGL